MSDAARAYQNSIPGAFDDGVYRVNGVDFDGFDQSIGLTEAKSSYANFVDSNGKFHDWFQGKDSLINQANRQVSAANGAPVTWYIQDQKTLDAMINLIGEGKGINFVLYP